MVGGGLVQEGRYRAVKGFKPLVYGPVTNATSDPGVR